MLGVWYNKRTMKKLYLMGYEHETLKGFLQRVQDEDITTVIDVREIPLSRKNGFSKTNLEKSLDKYGVKYYHYPQLGSPSSLRKTLKKDGDYLTFFKNYRKYIKKKKEVVNEVTQLVADNGKNSTLLCFEKHSDLCHRSIVASEILRLNPKIMVTPV